MRGRLMKTLLFAVVATAAAVSEANASGLGVAGAKISVIHIENGETFIMFYQPINNPDNCPSSNTITFPTSSPNYQGTLSILMTALATGKKISIWVSGCSYTPWGNTAPKAYAIQIADT